VPRLDPGGGGYQSSPPKTQKQKYDDILAQYGFNGDPYGFQKALQSGQVTAPQGSEWGGQSGFLNLFGVPGFNPQQQQSLAASQSKKAPAPKSSSSSSSSSYRSSSSGGGGGGGGGGTGLPGLPPGFPNPPSGKFTEADKARARDLIEMQFGPQFSALDREKKLANFDYDRLVKELEEAQQMGLATQQNYGQIGDKRLQDIFGTLQRELQGGLGKTQQIYQQGGQQIGDIYSKAQSTMDQAGRDVQGGLQNTAQALGLTQALPDPLARLSSELAGTKARTAEAGAAGQANIATLGAQMQGIGQQGISESHQELAGRRSDLVSEINNAMGKIQVEFTKGRRDLSTNLQRQLMDIADRYTALTGEKGVALRETLRQVEESRTDRERQYWLDKFNSQMQLAQLDLQRQSLAAQKSAASKASQQDPIDRALALQRLTAQERELQGSNSTGYLAGEEYLTSRGAMTRGAKGSKLLSAYDDVALVAPDMRSALNMVQSNSWSLSNQNLKVLQDAIKANFGAKQPGSQMSWEQVLAQYNK
jgi:hypothetical protein